MNAVRKTITRRAALMTAAAGLAATGSVAMAADASASTSAAYIRYGSHGAGVTCVQKALNYYDGAGLVVDGIDGVGTTHAIEHFQSEQGVTADGIVGPKTGNYIYYINYYDAGGSGCYAYIPTTY
ncbi:peptidoglycan-binding protein [Catenulispora sp. NF23]|uniref:Peptidoglycan-binding protein n=1 Tax=Catenulispora pinistramenti TaxID=2705254 RepID=A0ABS5L260_9ACTN|nr:peptidoglycan-binding domain-containing protein [Catenulispora pinistramenti]MBS2536679.1 peptidoglycan-binding protein [Catenulispora pinistramenti]MBS2552432.1 peptidoglycan-binding protein [Catenulispora pinistramenti]